MKYILVTGVSSGIGESIAYKLLENDYYIIGTVRKESDAKKFVNKHPQKFSSLVLDLTNQENVDSVFDHVSEITGGNNLYALVNNAGIAIGGPLMHQDINEIRLQFEINFFGLLNLTQKLLPLLGAGSPQENRHGKIINISSTNGKIVYPFVGAYCASKHALEAATDALRYELKIYGIDVVLIEPGSINTPIWDKAEKMDLKPYINTDYNKILANFKDEMVKIGKKGLSPYKVADIVNMVLRASNPKARYVVSGDYLNEWIIPRILPTRLMDYLITKETGIYKK